MNRNKLKNIIEAALMVANQPLNWNQLQALFEDELEKPEGSDIRASIAQLQQDYADRGIELKDVASGFRFQARAEYADWINKLFEDKSPRYSRALLEMLAIIVYRQPVTRGEIEDIRGVSVSSSIIKTLQERKWIKVVGHRDVPGRPALLATTRQFLDYFNLKQLADLPVLADTARVRDIGSDLFDYLKEESATESSKLESNEKVFASDQSGDNSMLNENEAQSQQADETTPVTH